MIKTQKTVQKTEPEDESEKVEESLRDFIAKIIGYYEKFNVTNNKFMKFEEMIAQSETLLEVFEVMKDMVDELMKNVTAADGLFE